MAKKPAAEETEEQKKETFMHSQKKVDLANARVSSLQESIKDLRRDGNELIAGLNFCHKTDDLNAIVATLQRVRDLAGEMRNRASRVVQAQTA
jgi:hypothetical protein